MNIREISSRSPYLLPALTLVWSVFLEFEAPEYCNEGIEEFKRYIAPDAVRMRLDQHTLSMWVCLLQDNTVAGVIALRPPCHISLMFVDKRFHHQGIARALFEHVLADIRDNTSHQELTVFSSPYAVGFYHRMGFTDTDTEQTVNGIRFIPMKRAV